MATDPIEEQLAGEPAELDWPLGNDAQPRLDDDSHVDVVEADERHIAVQAEVVERLHGADRDGVLGTEQGARTGSGVIGEQLPHRQRSAGQVESVPVQAAAARSRLPRNASM